MKQKQFYLQDSRNYVGNDVLWWRKNGAGYSSDLRQAEIYTKEQAMERHNSRKSDIPWEKDYIDKKTSPTVDMQYINQKEGALK